MRSIIHSTLRGRWLALGLVAGACAPSVPFTAPTPVVTAVFDPQTSQVPLPNRLVFLNPVNGVCPPPGNELPPTAPPACAQAELLALFGGEFPSDQEVAITIDFAQTTIVAGGTEVVAPDLDLATLTPETVVVVATTPDGRGDVALDPITADDYVKSDTHGTLSLHHHGREPWAAGEYAVFLRGGPDGVKTVDGTPVYASQVFYLIAQGRDMTAPENLGLLKAQTGSTGEAVALGRQLNLLIALYKDSAFPIVEERFPRQELAVMTTFTIGSAVTNVTIDPARGQVPLPIDLLRDATKGTLTPLAACTLAGADLEADGTCASPAAAGFLALDGFSTTGAILAPASELIRASTVTASTLMLFDLMDPAAPVQVPPQDLVLEPCEFTSGCGSPTALSPVIAIQPAGATANDPSSVFRSRPLKDGTDYAVIMTTGILDKAGRPLGTGTVANVLRFKNPIVVDGKSALRGIGDDTAASLEKMRLQLQPVFTKLAASNIEASKVAMAYTFRTQSFLGAAAKLAALPYVEATSAQTAMPIAGTFAARTPVAAFNKFGADIAVVGLGNIDEVLEVDITTYNALDPVTGAFYGDLATNPGHVVEETLHVLIATPKATNPNIPACTGPLAGFQRCAPLMVFRHGLGSGRAAMLTVADQFAAAGMVTVAIDAAKHGDRSFCTSGTTGAASGCKGGAECLTSLPAGAQGDAHPPGTCGAVGFVKFPVSSTCVGSCAALATDGIPAVSSNYLTSTNFFRTRDTLRQDLIDQSQLIRVLGFVPSGAPPTGHAVFDHMAARGVIIDPAVAYFSGQSLGAITGTLDVAANPRISKAAFNVGGGTVVDIFTNSPAFSANTDRLLAELGIVRGTARFLQFLVVAKTVLDPADPVNYAGHLTSNTLPNLLPPLGGNPNGSVPQAPKKVLTQVANCDQVVPNPFNFVYASTMATGPLPTGAAFFAPGGTGTFQLFVTTPFDPARFGTCTASTVQHGFLTDWVVPSLTVNAQADIAGFVMSNTLPLRVQHQ